MGFAKRKKDKRYRPFVMLPRKMLRSKEWKELSPAAKLFYVYLKGKYNGHNNGEIRLYYSELKAYHHRQQYQLPTKNLKKKVG